MRVRTEELYAANRELKARLRKGELTNKEYQPLLTKNKKEVENMRYEFWHFKDKRLASLFPEMAVHSYSYQTDRIEHTEEGIFNEIISLLQDKEATTTGNDD